MLANTRDSTANTLSLAGPATSTIWEVKRIEVAETVKQNRSLEIASFTPVQGSRAGQCVKKPCVLPTKNVTSRCSFCAGTVTYRFAPEAWCSSKRTGVSLGPENHHAACLRKRSCKVFVSGQLARWNTAALRNFYKEPPAEDCTFQHWAMTNKWPNAQLQALRRKDLNLANQIRPAGGPLLDVSCVAFLFASADLLVLGGLDASEIGKIRQRACIAQWFAVIGWGHCMCNCSGLLHPA